MKTIEVALVIWLSKNNSFYLQTRSENGPLDQMLEFPGGKLEPNESPKEAAVREFEEETQFQLTPSHTLQPFKIYSYSYPDRTVKLHTFILRDEELEFKNKTWYKIKYSNDILAANEEIINDLLDYINL